MNDNTFHTIPENLEAIELDTENSGFSMSSDRKIGSLLSTLAAAKPDGHFLELGTGTGLATSWLLLGMNQSALLDSVDNDQEVLEIARRHFDRDKRVTFHNCDGGDFITREQPDTYDLIFADAWPGKYSLLDETLALLKVGGIYVIDDMSPQPNWPEGHADKAKHLLGKFNRCSHLKMCRLAWATGIVICCRTE
ncbi:methyltransferase domain-containing protein [Aliifodinibius sp. S!AR15-10]|uniref:O-methyltransferase n=1 Tax=Aliifodinibius sp. S!AR15-10 TaxID=2950437 RepID=UPI00285620C1|nr:methyltransferase domain-containing protein [Aliifodinibius sp. S!AR15-10]MDR8393920.1 methyltransferase domain-containing protein [Aliifodinibius sp. S!AR15-10]